MSKTSATVKSVDQNGPITSPTGQPKVGIIMGSQSDWATMSAAAQLLTDFDIAFDCEVVSAHRTPDRLFDYAKNAKDNGLQVISLVAGGAAHYQVCALAKSHSLCLVSLSRSSMLRRLGNPTLYHPQCLKKNSYRNISDWYSWCLQRCAAFDSSARLA